MMLLAIILVTINYSLRDDGGIAAGGIDIDPSPNTITIRIVGPRTVTLTWDNPTTRVNGDVLPAEELETFGIRYTADGGAPVVVTGPIANLWTSPELVSGTYSFEVRVMDWVGWWSDYSESLEVAL